MGWGRVLYYDSPVYNDNNNKAYNLSVRKHKITSVTLTLSACC